MLLAKSKPITVNLSPIWRPPNEVDFIDHFSNVLEKLLFQSIEIYLLGDFNNDLFFEGHYFLKKWFQKT